MAINPCGVFEKFDPLEGEIPSEYNITFDYIVFMARKYLEGKTSGEIISIYERISKLYDETHASGAGINRLIEELEAKEKGLEHAIQPFTDSQNLLECWNIYRKENKVLDGVKWSEIFASQTLAFVSLSVLDEKEYEFCEDEQDDWDLYNASYKIATWGFDAMESLGYATMCYTIENHENNHSAVVEDLLNRKIKERNVKAITARHSKVNALKKEFLEYYSNGVFQSKADASRRFYEALPPEKKSLLVPTNAVRTLSQSLPKE